MPLKTQEEFSNAYSQICVQIGDRENKIRLLKAEIAKLHAGVDSLDVEYQAAKAQADAESAANIAAAEAKRAARASKAKAGPEEDARIAAAIEEEDSQPDAAANKAARDARGQAGVPDSTKV